MEDVTLTRRGRAIARAADAFADEKPLAWASRQLAEAAALGTLGLRALDHSRQPLVFRGENDRLGAERHLAHARLLAAGADAALIEQAIARARRASAAAALPLEDALCRHFALDLRLDLVETATALLDATRGAIERRLAAFGNSIETVRAEPPLPERDGFDHFAALLMHAVAETADAYALTATPFEVIDGGETAARMWRRWYLIDQRIIYVVDRTPVAAPQDIVWRLIHDAAHLAHLGDLAAAPDPWLAEIGDAPWIAVAEGFAMLAETAALGLGGPASRLFPSELQGLVELELLYGLLERAIRFASEVNGDYSDTTLADLAAASSFPLLAVADTVREWQGLVGMGSCYLLGLLLARKAQAAGNLRRVLRYEDDPPDLDSSDVDQLVTALEQF